MHANESEFCDIEEDAFAMMAVMSHTEELMRFRFKNRKGGKVDMYLQDF